MIYNIKIVIWLYLGFFYLIIIKYKLINPKKLIVFLENLKKHNIKLLKNTILKLKKNPVYHNFMVITFNYKYFLVKKISYLSILSISSFKNILGYIGLY